MQLISGFLEFLARGVGTSPLILNAQSLLFGFVVTALLLPTAMRLARRYRVLDYPDSTRHKHANPVPRVGGVVVMLGVWVAVLLMWAVSPGPVPRDWLPFGSAQTTFIVAVLVIFVTGLMDDITDITPLMKLTMQSLAALLLVGAGVEISAVTLAESSRVVSLGVWSVPVTVLWLVGVTNAFNLIDGMDGLAAWCAFIGVTVILAAESVLADKTVFIMGFASIGAMVAFALRNRHPAQVFLGDAGSTSLGFYLGARSLVGASDGAGVVHVLIPLAVVAYPLADTAVAILRRLLRRHPISQADARHIHHQLLAIGFSPPQAVTVIGVGSVVVAAFALSISFAAPQYTLALGLFAVVALLFTIGYGVHWLGYGEFRAFGGSVHDVLRISRECVRQRIAYNDVAERIAKAETGAEVRALVQSLADGRFIASAQLLPEREGCRAQVQPIQTQPPELKVEYPLPSFGHGGETHSVVLWATSDGVKHHSAERAARIVGRSLADWLRERERMRGQHPQTLENVAAT